MNRCTRTLTASAVTLVMLALVLAIDAWDQANPPPAAGDGAEVLATIEVRGRRYDLSDGRTARIATAAPGLTVAPTPSDPPTPSVVPTPSDRPTPSVVPRRAALAPPTALPVLTPDPSSPPPAPTPEAAPTPIPTTVPEPTLATRGAEALALIDYAWQTRVPGWTVEFLPYRDGLRGVALSSERRIELYVRDGQDRWDLARVLAHELGHAVDVERLSTGDRRRWQQARGLDEDVPWWPDSGAPDFASGAGDFAECFATWQMGSASLSQVGGRCSVEDLGLVAALS